VRVVRCNGILSTPNNNSTDSLFDGGTNRVLVNSLDLCSKYKLVSDYIYLADGTAIPVIAVGTFGIFDNVFVVPSLTQPLISTKILCYPPFNFIIVHIDNMGYILDRYKDPHTEDIVVTTVSIRKDGLYHFDNLSELVNYKGLPKGPRPQGHVDITTFIPLPEPELQTFANALSDADRELKRRHLYGGSKAKYAARREVGCTPLQQLHIKLGHQSEKIIKWQVQHGIVQGMNYSWDQIRNCKLELCPA